MSAPDPQRPRPLGRLARLAAVLSLRTISGKLIVGLLVLFGLASIIVSVVTANSLNSSLMSSLDQQLQTATQAWRTCAMSIQGDGDHGQSGHGDPDGASGPGYGACSNSGQAAGTLEEVLQPSGTVSYKNRVSRICTLSATDEATLVSLQTATNQSPPNPDRSPARGRPRRRCPPRPRTSGPWIRSAANSC